MRALNVLACVVENSYPDRGYGASRVSKPLVCGPTSVRLMNFTRGKSSRMFGIDPYPKVYITRFENLRGCEIVLSLFPTPIASRRTSGICRGLPSTPDSQIPHGAVTCSPPEISTHLLHQMRSSTDEDHGRLKPIPR